MMNLLEPLLAYSAYLPLVIRVPFGLSLMIHGYPKTPKERLQRTRAGVESVMKVPAATANIAAILEFVGGLFMIVGLIVPIVAFFYIIFFGSITVVKKTRMGAVFTGRAEHTYEIDVFYLLVSGIKARMKDMVPSSQRIGGIRYISRWT